MAFTLQSTINKDGKCTGNLVDENAVVIAIGGMPGLNGDPTQSELAAHIIKEMKLAMQRAIENAQP